MTTVLDFGHGGIIDGVYTTAPRKMFDFGDVVAYEGVINREIGKKIAECLPNVVLTAPDADDVPLKERVRIANEYPDSVFVSIHCNASPKHNAGGFEIYTTHKRTKSDLLALEIHKAVKPTLERYGIKDRGIREADFYVLRNTTMPAVLIECGFFDYRPDFDVLTNEAFQKDFASFVATGILNYFNAQKQIFGT